MRPFLISTACLAALAGTVTCSTELSAQSLDQVLRQKTARLKARNPAKEAAVAIERGDSRLAGTNHIGLVPTGWDASLSQ